MKKDSHFDDNFSEAVAKLRRADHRIHHKRGPTHTQAALSAPEAMALKITDEDDADKKLQTMINDLTHSLQIRPTTKEQQTVQGMAPTEMHRILQRGFDNSKDEDEEID